MKRILAHTAITAALTLGAFAPAALAKTKRHSAAHNAAVMKCNEDYNAAVKEARTKKGRERQEAMTAAKQSRKECISQAPR